MSLGESILLLAIGAVFGVFGTILTQTLNNRFQRSSTREQRLQAKRDEYAARFRPLMTDIIASIDKLQRRAIRIDGNYGIDLQKYDTSSRITARD
jgi:hypothetical protein